MAEGFARSGHAPTLESDFYAELRQSNGVFAAFKVHSMAEKMAALLTDADGKLKPFYQWKAEVESIATHYVGPWLRTEYNTAVIRAHNAADWLQFERNRDIMPNLRWMPTTSPNPEAEHRRFWEMKLTRPIDDPFWNKHRPGDRWNCKCSLEATDEPPTDIPDDADDEKPQRGLRGNPAKTGQIFDKSHPYFPKNCASCGFNKKKGTITSRMRGWFNAENKPCESCTYYLEATDALRREASQWKETPPPKANTYKSLYDGKVFASPYHGKNEWAANEEMAKFLADRLGKKIYMLPRLDPSNPTHALLRKKLLPLGVPEDKSPDYLIGGMIFDAKSLFNVKRREDGYQNSIINHLKKAKKQAPNIILDIPGFIDLNEAGKAISDFLRQSKHDRVVLVRRKGKLYMYKKKASKI